MAKMSLNDLRTRASTVDRAKLDATTDEDIRRHKAEDGYGDQAPPEAVRDVVPPKALRIRLALTQQEMADALRIPVGTWRNWEQGRVALDPAARSLLAIVHTNPEMALGALKLSAGAERLSS
jgi:putative transcriptional regulator